MIKKSKWLVLTIAIMLVFGLSAGAAGAKEANNNADGLKVKHIAAPAVANQLLKEADLKHHYNNEGEKGNYISEVARHMGEGTDFDGISKQDAGAYKVAIASFLNNGLVPAGIPLYDLVETIEVDSKEIGGATSTVVMEVYSDYMFKVSGEWINNRTPDADAVDAEYTSQDAWTNYLPGPNGYDEKLLDLQIDSEFVDWGDYNPDHEYQYNFTGTGAVVNFRVFEGNVENNEIELGWYGDNNGLLLVKIYKARWQ